MPRIDEIGEAAGGRARAQASAQLDIDGGLERIERGVANAPRRQRLVLLAGLVAAASLIAGVVWLARDRGHSEVTTIAPADSTLNTETTTPTTPTTESTVASITAPSVATTPASKPGGASAAASTEPTLLMLQDTDPVLTATETLMSLDGYNTYRGAVSPTGEVLLAKEDKGHYTIVELQADGSVSDTRIAVDADSALGFGPHGDLFVRQFLPAGDFQRAGVYEFRRAGDGVWEFVTAVDGDVTGECGFVATPNGVGCPAGTGPQIVFDPPVEFDRVETQAIDFAGPVGTVRRLGDSATEHSWTTWLDTSQPVNCDDNTCYFLAQPGPGNSAVWLPYVDGAGPSQRAVFVLDDRSAAGAAWLDPSITMVLGRRGTDLIGVQTIGVTSSLVAIDLSSVLGPD